MSSLLHTSSSALFPGRPYGGPAAFRRTVRSGPSHLPTAQPSSAATPTLDPLPPTDPFPSLGNAHPPPPASHLASVGPAFSDAGAAPAPARSFAAVMRNETSSRFPPIDIPKRPKATRNGIPAVLFTPAELKQGYQQMETSVVAKFSAGKPKAEEIRAFIR